MATSIFKVKKDIVEVCRRIYQRGYVAANDGNVSVRIDEKHVVLTPTGMSKGYLQPSDLVVLDLDGNKVSGTSKPSSESKMHLSIYRGRPDIKAVVHAHPPTATGFAVAGIPLTQCILPEVIISVGAIPIAEYATPGTQALADVVVRYLKQYDAVLLENHGAITVGSCVYNAHFKMETMEHFAKIMFVAYQLGNVRGLPAKDVEELIALRKKFGIRSDSPVCECELPDMKPQPATAVSGQISPDDRKVIEDVTRRVLDTMSMKPA